MKLPGSAARWALHRETINQPTIKVLGQLQGIFDSVMPMRALVFDAIPSHVNTYSSFLVQKGNRQNFLKIGALESVLTEVKHTTIARHATRETAGIEVLPAKTIFFREGITGFTTSAVAGLTLDGFRSARVKATKQKLQELVITKLLDREVVWPGFADRNIIVRDNASNGRADSLPRLVLVDWERGIHSPSWVGTVDGVQRSIELIEEASVSSGRTIPYWHADVPPFHTVHNEHCESGFRIHVEKRTAPRVYTLTDLLSAPNVATITEYSRYSRILATNNDNDTGPISTLYAADTIESAGFLNLRVLLDLILWYATKFQPSRVQAVRNAILSVAAKCSYLMAQEFLQRICLNTKDDLFDSLYHLLDASSATMGYDLNIGRVLQTAKSYVFSNSVLPPELVEPEVLPVALIGRAR